MSKKVKLFKQQSVNDALATARNIATHLIHSSSWRKLLQDIHTTWPWTALYFQIRSQGGTPLIICWNALWSKKKGHHSSLYVKKNCSLTNNQWELAETLVIVFKHFETATKEMSYDNACALQIMPFIILTEKYLDFAAENASGVKNIVPELKHELKKESSHKSYCWFWTLF